MNPEKLLVAMTTLAMIALCACHVSTSDNSTSTAEVTVYGSTSCTYTTGLMSEMDEENIKYTFKDLDNDQAAMDELTVKLLESDWYEGGSALMPLVDIDGTLLERPTLEEVEALL